MPNADGSCVLSFMENPELDMLTHCQLHGAVCFEWSSVRKVLRHTLVYAKRVADWPAPSPKTTRNRVPAPRGHRRNDGHVAHFDAVLGGPRELLLFAVSNGEMGRVTS